jgi:hypothetical protein
MGELNMAVCINKARNDDPIVVFQAGPFPEMFPGVFQADNRSLRIEGKYAVLYETGVRGIDEISR